MSIDFIKSVYFELVSYMIPEKLKYKIEGSCNQCGRCCREIRAKGMRNEKDLKIMQFIFPWYKNFYIINKIDNEIVLSCKHLKDNGQCGIYKFRPLLCRRYPAKHINFNTEMIDGCGYKIIKKEFKDYL